jgi:hypothetical protein
MSELKTTSARSDVLLVVSTDHWLRKRSYQVNDAESSRPIPLLMWKVGQTEGIVISRPVSTFHTASMILDYLDGRVSTQADIANWWEHQTVYPSFIAPNT